MNIACCRYIWSLYWSITTLATVGYGDLHAYGPIEAGFILIYMLFGIILNAYILGKQTTQQTTLTDVVGVVNVLLHAVWRYSQYLQYILGMPGLTILTDVVDGINVLMHASWYHLNAYLLGMPSQSRAWLRCPVDIVLLTMCKSNSTCCAICSVKQTHHT